ncbi:Biopolymer transport protein ExbD/TolR [hydrothermal vent metagenome]|uniref:Biopolymer transport protein ExbD/TolR n=1 Tax=hydrothermal vent metagenome TaxID=652676 RepID=A0A3B1DSS4_9ZZZZ
MKIIRAKKPHLSMDLAPLIDVVFQLLVFFMLTSTFSNPAIQLDLPKAVASDEVQQENVVISIDENGLIFLNEQSTSVDAFKDDLRILLKKMDKKSVNIKGDQDMPYKHFVQIMDLAKQAGAIQINIVHQKE